MSQLRVGVEIIIVNWNTCELLQDCLTSVFQNVPSELPPNFALQVTVVDNASSDDSVQMIRGQFPQVKLLQNERNVGFAAANNLAMGQSQLTYFLLLNSDTVVLKNSIGPLLTFMEQQPRAGMCGPRLLNADYSLQSSGRDFPQPIGDFLNKIELYRWPRLYAAIFPGKSARFNYKQLSQIDWLSGACLLVRHAAYTQVGPMDANYFFYGEEMDWCYRFKQVGWQIWFVPQAELIHLGGQSSRRVPYQRILWLNQSQLRFYRKFYPLQKRLSYYISNWAATLPKLAALGLLLPLSEQTKRRHRWQLFKTYWKVLWLSAYKQK